MAAADCHGHQHHWLCQVCRNLQATSPHQRGACASMIAPANSSHIPQTFLQLGRLQGAEAPSDLAGLFGSEQECGQVGQQCPHVEAAVVNIWL